MDAHDGLLHLQHPPMAAHDGTLHLQHPHMAAHDGPLHLQHPLIGGHDSPLHLQHPLMAAHDGLLHLQHPLMTGNDGPLHLQHPLLTAGDDTPWLPLQLARHDEQGFHFETFVLRAQSLGVIVFLHVHPLCATDDHVDGHVVIPSVFQHHQPAMNSPKDQV